MTDSKLQWLIFAYSLPPEPSRLRVSIWRRLRKLGAIYLSEGIWVLPNSESLARELQAVIQEIRQFNGTVSAFVSSDFEESQKGRLRERVLAARNEEYAELQGQCSKYLLHVDRATRFERYMFSEVEELEEEFAKIERWLQEIKSRDIFTSPQYETSFALIEQCRGELQRFTERAYLRSGSFDEEKSALE